MMKKIFRRFYVGLMMFFIYAPIIVLIVFSFNVSKSRGHWDGFSLKWYSALFKDREVIIAFYYTMVVAVISTICSTLLGTTAAIGIHYMKGVKKIAVLNLNYLPVLNPDIVIAVSLMALFQVINIDFGLLTMIIAHIVFCTPYVILSILPKLKQLNNHLFEAAMDLGATPMYAIRKILLKEIAPGILTGALMAFTLSIDDFTISFFNSGKGVKNLSIYVYSMAKKGINPTLNALSTIMFFSLMLLLIIINYRNNKEKKAYEK